jgi:nucleosome binding factor SPN SPT16 subunit
MEKEALLLPINGRSVPFHISTIKNISMPEQDRATWMRINFFIPGVALGKDVAKNVQQLVRCDKIYFNFNNSKIEDYVCQNYFAGIRS